MSQTETERQLVRPRSEIDDDIIDANNDNGN